jgi:hypothetical protein
MKVIPETRLLKRIVLSKCDIYVLLHVLVRFFHIGGIVDYRHCLKSVSITVLMPDYKLTNYAPESMDVTMTVDMIIGCRQALWSKNRYCLARNEDNVSEGNGMFTRGLLFL